MDTVDDGRRERRAIGFTLKRAHAVENNVRGLFPATTFASVV